MLVERTAPVLSLYAVGNAFLVFNAFPYYLQYAKGDLKLHVIGNALLIALLIPSVILAATIYGMKGAGWAWLILNCIYFIIWTPIVHNKFAKNISMRWMLKDVLRPVAIQVPILLLVSNFMRWSEDRLTLLIEVALLSALALGVMIYCVRKLMLQNK